MTRLVLAISTLIAVSALPACGEESLGGVRWACESDDDCGSDATCRLGLCVDEDSPAPTGGRVCDVAAAAGGDGTVRFAVSVRDDGTRALTFAANGHIARFSLPAEVVSLDAGPLEGCCENPCCAFRQ